MPIGMVWGDPGVPHGYGVVLGGLGVPHIHRDSLE